MGHKRHDTPCAAQWLRTPRGAVARALGLNETSAGPFRAPQRRALMLSADTSHFTHQGTWSDQALREAIGCSSTWAEALRWSSEPMPMRVVSTAAGRSQIGQRPYELDKSAGRTPYDPDSIDYFFVIDGDYEVYLIPSNVVAGRLAINVGAYRNFAA